MRSLLRRAIDRGHRRLLETFREFGLHDGEAGRPDPDTLRGAAAFLEEELPHFARWEADRLPPGTLREVIAFEHAFLRAEVDAFVRSARGLLRHLERGGLYPEGRWDQVRRRAARVEVALELHTEKLRDEDLEWPGDAGEDGPRTGRRPARGER